MTPTIFHNENDTSHWSPERAAAAAQQQRFDELNAQIRQAEYPFSPGFPEVAMQLFAELNRVAALTPLEYAAELDAAQAQADAEGTPYPAVPGRDSLAAEVAEWADVVPVEALSSTTYLSLDNGALKQQAAERKAQRIASLRKQGPAGNREADRLERQ